MTAVLDRGARTLEVAACAAPPPGPGEVRIAVAYTGICGTDLAGATVFVAAPASDYVSGIVLPVDDGWLGL